MQVVETRQQIDRLTRIAKVKCFWIKAHCGIKFNERADELAKTATTEGTNTTVRAGKSYMKARYKRQALGNGNGQAQQE